jgi:rfaE bifunctional protein nucleotidyltransferase chain/domain
MDTAVKVIPFLELAKWRAQIDDSFHPLLVTSGCFDILHHGHVQQLERMRSLGRFLLVGIDCDESVRVNKGPSRPIIPAIERARILAGLTSVDAVTIFTSPAEFILTAQPDVFMKGGDWPIEKLPAVERESIRATGAIYQTLPRPPGNSSEILARAKAAAIADSNSGTMTALR